MTHNQQPTPRPGAEPSAELRQQMARGVATFKYLKQDGTPRTALGTLHPQLIPADKRPKPQNTFNGYKHGYEPYFDLQRLDWRCYAPDDVLWMEEENVSTLQLADPVFFKTLVRAYALLWIDAYELRHVHHSNLMETTFIANHDTGIVDDGDEDFLFFIRPEGAHEDDLEPFSPLHRQVHDRLPSHQRLTALAESLQADLLHFPMDGRNALCLIDSWDGFLDWVELMGIDNPEEMNHELKRGGIAL